MRMGRRRIVAAEGWWHRSGERRDADGSAESGASAGLSGGSAASGKRGGGVADWRRR